MGDDQENGMMCNYDVYNFCVYKKFSVGVNVFGERHGRFAQVFEVVEGFSISIFPNFFLKNGQDYKRDFPVKLTQKMEESPRDVFKRLLIFLVMKSSREILHLEVPDFVSVLTDNFRKVLLKISL